MDNFITSFVRTYVPIVVGAIASYLLTKGIELDANAQLGLVTFLTGLLQAVYYLIVRVVERKFPKFGWLLGSPKVPVYKEVK